MNMKVWVEEKAGILMAVFLGIAAAFGLNFLCAADEAGIATGHGRLGAVDYQFVLAAAHDTRMEVALGHIGVQNGSNAAVRAFAQQTVDDRQKVLEEMTLLATQKGVSLPEMATVEDKNQLALGALSGPEFDPPYMKCMVGNNVRAVSLFQTEGDAGMDPDLKAWAAKLTPLLQQHLQIAQNTWASLAVGK